MTEFRATPTTADEWRAVAVRLLSLLPAARCHMCGIPLQMAPCEAILHREAAEALVAAGRLHAAAGFGCGLVDRAPPSSAPETVERLIYRWHLHAAWLRSTSIEEQAAQEEYVRACAALGSPAVAEMLTASVPDLPTARRPELCLEMGHCYDCHRHPHRVAAPDQARRCHRCGTLPSLPQQSPTPIEPDRAP